MKVKVSDVPCKMELLRFLLLVLQTCEALRLLVPNPQSALVGSNAVITCEFQVGEPRVDPGCLSVTWHFEKHLILNFTGKERTSNPRYSVDSEGTKQGVASLFLRKVTFDDKGIYKCSVIYCAEEQGMEVHFYVQALPLLAVTKNTVVRNVESLLRCSASGFRPINIEFMWHMDGEEIWDTILHKPKLTSNGTYTVNSEAKIKPTEDYQNRTFSCQAKLKSHPLRIQKNFTILFGESPSLQLVVDTFQEGREQNLLCRVWGFQPKPVSVNWLLNGTRLDPAKAKLQTINDSFIECHYPFTATPDQEGMEISCQVEHCTLAEPLQNTTRIHLKEANPAPWINTIPGIILIVFIVLIVLVASFGGSWLFKPWQTDFKVNHIVGPEKIVHGAEVRLECIASYGENNLEVQWLEVKDNTERDIAHFLSRNGQRAAQTPPSHVAQDEERLELMLSDGEYTGDISIVNDHGRLLHKSFLSFTADISYHTGVTYICTATSRRTRKEERYTCAEVLVKPNPSKDAPQITESGEVQFSLHLQDFFPENMSIEWRGRTKQLTSQFRITNKIVPNSDGTYNMLSVCYIPKRHAEDPLFAVTVAWKHKSMENAEEWRITQADLPWRPLMERINVPRVLLDEEVRTQCVISNYFPNNLDIRWYKQKPGSLRELLARGTEGKYRINDEEHAQENKAFTLNTSLSFTPSLDDDQGAEFICQAQHPSLEHPLESSTGGLVVMGRPEPESILFIDDESFRLTVDKYFPKEICIEWQLEDPTVGTFTKLCSDISTSNNPNGSFKTVSTCRPPVDLIQTNRTCVMWAEISHQAQDPNPIKMSRPIERKLQLEEIATDKNDGAENGEEKSGPKQETKLS
ncbi:uncharacterized protein LOC128502274 [Spea bombifrons]|uniref:uncharacterized protein LOC128502274 n=1 Tax=Spea bombifrons TaxID=233779 RepID=UPI00234A97BB|nr:uncharacterized protein LOC128502274 [Spea bombifrons]